MIFMEDWVKTLLTVLATVLASNGFWAFLQYKANKKDVRTQMLIGLGHDRIMYLGKQYISRGWVTADEYENLNKYLYEPYIAIGGNGAAKHLMEKVQKLPIKED